MISQILLEANNQRKGVTEPETNFTFKILIHKFVAGCILGKAGAIVKEIQETSKARVGLSSDVMPGSTEKTITVSGPPEALYAACERIVQQMATNPLRPGTAVSPYIPGAAVAAFPTLPAGFGAPGLPGFPPAAFGAANPYDQTQRTEKIVIPAECGSMLIGKAGSVIKNIKSQSGTLISLSKPDPSAPGDQVVSITGTSQGIQAALYLIRQRVDSYQRPPEQQQMQQQQQYQQQQQFTAYA
jgi:polyribonucleotide nucleotidyltransferase